MRKREEEEEESDYGEKRERKKKRCLAGIYLSGSWLIFFTLINTGN